MERKPHVSLAHVLKIFVIEISIAINIGISFSEHMIEKLTILTFSRRIDKCPTL